MRQGRAFGIHVLLGSQTLGGAYTLARTTLGQMVIRIALQCNEADAYLIMDENNPAPRLLSRPGEGIYNDTAGMIEGNSPFQVVWLPDEERDELASGKVDGAQAESPSRGGRWRLSGPDRVRGQRAGGRAGERAAARAAGRARPPSRPPPARIWLGAPNSIKGPTEAVFQRQSGNNLLIVGQRDEAVLAMLSVGLVSLAAQYPLGDGALHSAATAPRPAPPQREFIERVAAGHPARRSRLAKAGDLGEDHEGAGRGAEAARPKTPDAEAAPPVFLFIHGLQKFKQAAPRGGFQLLRRRRRRPPNPGPAAEQPDLRRRAARHSM